jgi:hypothetical protein
VDYGSVERATVLIVRAWTETGPPRTLKVRMLTEPPTGSAPVVVGVTTDIDQACELLRSWLADVASGEPDPSIDPTGDPPLAT